MGDQPSLKIDGDFSGQLIIGDYGFQFRAEGDVVNPVFVTDPVQPRSRPVNLRPGRIDDLVGRDSTIAEIANAVGVENAQLLGGDGWGKTSVLKHLTYHGIVAGFPDGVAFIAGHGLPSEDIAQTIFEAFFDSKLGQMGFVATAGQLRAALSDVRALIVVDDLDLDRHDVETLLDLAPNSTYITAAHQQSMWTSGLTLDLVGLTPADGQKVFERHLRSVVPAGEAAVVLQFCAAAHGYPMAIVAAAAAVRRGRLTFADLGTISRLDDPTTATFEALADSLTNEEQRALAVLNAVEGAALPAEAVTAATNTDSQAVLATLRADGIVQAASPRFRLPRAIAERLELPDWHVETVDGLTSWADHATNPDAVAAAGAAINNSIAWATQNQRSDKGLALARAADRGLALSGRWGLWTEMLSQALTAARTAASRFDEAWVMHQRGTLALCVGDRGTAERELRAAESIRTSIGDHAGLAVTKHNLDVLTGPPPTPQEPQEPPPPPEPTSPSPPSPPPGGGIPGWLWMVFFVILVGGGWGVYQYFQDGEGPPTTNAPPSASFLQVDPERIDFGVVPPLTERALGRAGAVPDDRSAQVFVSNPGEVPIDDMEFFFEDGDVFELINECRPLEPGDGCRLIINFMAVEPGRYEDVLHIDHEAENPNYEIFVAGAVENGDLETEPETADLVGGIGGFGSTNFRSGEEGVFTYWAIPVAVIIENLGETPVSTDFFVHFEWFNPERGAFEFIPAGRSADRLGDLSVTLDVPEFGATENVFIIAFDSERFEISQPVTVRVKVDSCFGIEFTEDPPCMVVESNEDNNVSEGFDLIVDVEVVQ